MPLAIETVTIDCADGPRLADFWMAALGYELAASDGDWRLIADPAGRGVKVALDPVPEGKVVKNRVHLDIFPTEPGPAAWVTEVGRLVALGATRYRYLAESPEEAHWILHDPEGNEFCCVLRR
jgi:hypothetical protein